MNMNTIRTTILREGSFARLIYGNRSDVDERHRHRYEVNNKYRDILIENGLTIGGVSPDNNLVEMIEIQDHPYFVASQFHPEFKSRPWEPAPLFYEFISASLKTKSSESNNIVTETIKKK